MSSAIQRGCAGEEVIKTNGVRLSRLNHVDLPRGTLNQWTNSKLQVDFFDAEVKQDCVSAGYAVRGVFDVIVVNLL